LDLVARRLEPELGPAEVEKRVVEGSREESAVRDRALGRSLSSSTKTKGVKVMLSKKVWREEKSAACLEGGAETE
jgi:hypothetical protein